MSQTPEQKAMQRLQEMGYWVAKYEDDHSKTLKILQNLLDDYKDLKNSSPCTRDLLNLSFKMIKSLCLPHETNDYLHLFANHARDIPHLNYVQEFLEIHLIPRHDEKDAKEVQTLRESNNFSLKEENHKLKIELEELKLKLFYAENKK